MGGQLDVLNVGEGHLKIEIDEDDPEGVAKARRIIEDMLERGYAIFIETARGPRRVRRFMPKRMVYLIDDAPENPQSKAERNRTREAPVSSSKATAVGRSAGG